MYLWTTHAVNFGREPIAKWYDLWITYAAVNIRKFFDAGFATDC